MNEAKLQSFRQQLKQERDQIVERLDDTDSYGLARPMNDAVSELSGYDNHPGDLGSEMFEREKDLSLRDADNSRLQNIDEAMDRIENGTYGSCARCGADIAEERLAISPEARYCITCQRNVEEIDSRFDHPVEEEITAPPFARTFMDDTDYNAFDGEDSWQAVLRFNQRPQFTHDDEYLYDDDNEGIVDEMDRISNEQYFEQLPD